MNIAAVVVVVVVTWQEHENENNSEVPESPRSVTRRHEQLR